MKEFMLLVFNNGDNKADLSQEAMKDFLTACETYIDRLQAKGQLIAAQPLLRQGVSVSGTKDSFTETAIDATTQIQVGYYHILAADIGEAIAIAKDNPEFSIGPKASIDVRPIKMKEPTTGFEYPKK